MCLSVSALDQPHRLTAQHADACTPCPPHVLLLLLPWCTCLWHTQAGAYTTARTVEQQRLVFKLSSHIQRLATSANLMMDADSKVGAGDLSRRLAV
jgi:hypothetical protein